MYILKQNNELGHSTVRKCTANHVTCLSYTKPIALMQTICGGTEKRREMKLHWSHWSANKNNVISIEKLFDVEENGWNLLAMI